MGWGENRETNVSDVSALWVGCDRKLQVKGTHNFKIDLGSKDSLPLTSILKIRNSTSLFS